MKVTRHSLLAKGIMVLLSLLVLVFAFTYTWFRDPSKPITASGLSLSTRNTSTDFEYAVGFSNSQTGGSYKHTRFTNTVNTNLNLEALLPSDESDTTKTVNLLYDYNPTDITGNGVTLVRPAMNYGNWNINTASRNYSIAEENVQYISFDLIFRTHVADTTIRLDSDSFAKGNCEQYSGDDSLLRDTDSFNKENKYGAFSTDAIVGAARVAFLEYEANEGSTITSGNLVANDLVRDGIAHYSETPLLLWVPRPDLFLDNGTIDQDTIEQGLAKDGLTTGWSLVTGISGGTRRLVSKAQTASNYSTYEHQYYNVFQVGSTSTPGIVTYEDAVASVLDTTAATNKVTFGQQTDLIKLDYYEDFNNNNEVDGEDYYYGKVRVRIWIEGTDSESRRALAGGKFSVGFHITG